MKFHPFSFKFIDIEKSINTEIVYRIENLNELNTKLLLAIKLPEKKKYINFKTDYLHTGDIIRFKDNFYIFHVKNKNDTSYSEKERKMIGTDYYDSMGLYQLEIQSVASESITNITLIHNSYKKLNKTFLSSNQMNNENEVTYIMNFYIHKEELNEVFNELNLGYEYNQFKTRYRLNKLSVPDFLISSESENENGSTTLQEHLISRESLSKLYEIEKNADWNIILSEFLHAIQVNKKYIHATGTYFYVNGKKLSNPIQLKKIDEMPKGIQEKFIAMFNFINESFLCLNKYGLVDFHHVFNKQSSYCGHLFYKKVKHFSLLGELLEKIDKIKIYASEQNSLIGQVYEQAYLKLISSTEQFFVS